MTRTSSLSISSSFSRSIKLLTIADPAAEKIKHKSDNRVIWSDGTPEWAITIPVNPVKPTLNIIFGFDRDITAFKYFIN